MKTKDIQIGSIYKELIVVEHLGLINNQNFYLCKCSCGDLIKICKSRLLNQKVIHRGCKNIVNKKHHNLKYLPQEASFRAKATNYKAIAKNRKLEFSISIDKTIELLKQNCFYCNQEPNNDYNAIIRNRNSKTQYNFYKVEDYNIKYNGIDRIDSSKGYTENNCVSCCKFCNTAKLDRNQEDFKKWIVNLYKNYIK